MLNRYVRAAPGLFLAGLVAAACSDAGSRTLGEIDVTLSTDAEGLLASAAAGDARTGGINADTVETLVVRVTRIDLLPVTADAPMENAATGDEEEQGGWVSLEMNEPVIVDLMTLPRASETPIVIASGQVEVGEYRKVRLVTDSASVRFRGPITVGPSTLDAGADHIVTIPSGEESGLKTDAGVTVDAEAATSVSLLFSPSATFKNFHGTGSGRILLAPVLRGGPSEN